MANILYANNATGTLASAITNAATTLTLNAGQAALFPNPSAPQVFYVTLTDAATETLIEIVQVTAVSGNNFSIVRGQDGTSPLSWNAGDVVSLRVIRLELQGFENAAEGIFTGVILQPSSTLGIQGTAGGDNANAGSIGEFSDTGSVGPVLASSGTTTQVGSFGLPAGDFDASVTALFVPPAGQTLVSATIALSATPVIGGVGTFSTSGPAASGFGVGIVSPLMRFNANIPQTANPLALATSSAGGPVSVTWRIRARRVR